MLKTTLSAIVTVIHLNCLFWLSVMLWLMTFNDLKPSLRFTCKPEQGCGYIL